MKATKVVVGIAAALAMFLSVPVLACEGHHGKACHCAKKCHCDNHKNCHCAKPKNVS